MRQKIKRYFRRIKRKFPIIFKSIFFYFLKRLAYLVIVFVIAFLIIILKAPINLTTSILVSFTLIPLTVELLNLSTKILNYLEKRRLSKPYKKAQNVNLYRWSEGIEVEERFFYLILKPHINGDVIKDLNSIKEKINISCSGDPSNLKLLKVYVERGISNNFFYKFLSIFIGIVVSIITTIFNKFSSTDGFTQWVNNFISGSNSALKASDITTMINYGTYFIIGYIFITYTWSLFTRDQRRLDLFNKIIDISISEIESEHASNRNL